MRSDSAGEGGADWRRLAARTIVVMTLTWVVFAAVAGVPAAATVTFVFPVSLETVLAWGLPPAALLVVAGFSGDCLRWWKTRYRVHGGRFEISSGVFVRRHRVIPLDRIRSVDLTAELMLRICGLAKVEIGTGEQADPDESSVELELVTRAEADRLRRVLLGRPSATPEPETTSETLAKLDPRWARFAPLSVESALLGAGALGGALSAAEFFGLRPDAMAWAFELLSSLPLAVAILLVIGVGSIAGSAGALLVYVMTWWNFRLERESRGVLRIRRGLLTSFSVSLEESRLRGVEVTESLGHRILRAARVDAVETGLVQQVDDEESDHQTVLPPAPRALAHQVAGLVLRDPALPTDPLYLRGHSRAARDRRLVRAVVFVLTVAVALVILGVALAEMPLYVAWIWMVTMLPLAMLVAVDAYRNLGHGIVGGYLVVRSGSPARTTVALQRTGVIGWVIRESMFERRRGLITLTATTAAGSGEYSAYDVGLAEGLALADAATQGVVGPFVERGRHCS
ncbi:PH domain-containing protein [Phytoactinopolyspora limicola]|uniref:PH domain-containing protein n=1 Tax=Phytoactinopolyspora limicola TaxID=2715536 RepID=UPI001A9CB5FB|nr:PH domain-containing protein [Phytoactinopolyspora limicola]